MRLTLRAKLAAIVATSALAFVALIVVGAYALTNTEAELATIEGHYLPKVDLQPRLEAQLERLQRAYQDAVAAHDLDALAAAPQIRDAFLEQLAGASSALDPAQAGALRAALDVYTRAAGALSRRLIAGETGEPLVAAMDDMQERRNRVAELIRTTTALDRGELATAFRVTSRVLETNTHVRIAVCLGCFALVLVMSFWLGRGVVRSLAALTSGLARFGEGDFTKAVIVETNDELGEVARRANEMADSLRRLSAERAHATWLKAGQAGLASELHGELEPAEVAARAVRFLARALEAPAAALYTSDDDGGLQLAAQHALASAAGGGAPARFERGEGLVGEAALHTDLTVVAEPPPEYLRVRSALGEAPPRAIALLPLWHAGRVAGVLELAVFKPWSDTSAELLTSVRDTLALALVAARGRAATRDLLAATQRQAAKLAAQEEELRATNEELQAQEEELRQANTDLSRQKEELETQRQLLAERNDALDEARVRLEHRAAELTTVSAYKSQFLANMSHELRTPLNSMLLLSNLLAENEGGTLAPREVEFARTIYAAGRDLLALINQVLDLAKVESGRQEIEIAAVPLREIAARAERVFAPLARDKGLAFGVTLADGLPDELATDRRRLEQILTNLLGNAIKFTQRGEVTLRIAPAPADAKLRRRDLAPADVVAFSVTDTGLGIAAEDHERVFAPFEQVDAATDRRYGGTGLGLGIARELATLLGGELQLASALGAGSTFVFYLPLQAPASVAAAPAVGARHGHEVARAVSSPGPSSASSSVSSSAPVTEPFLLLIEDDPVFASTFAEVIQAQGLACVRAPSGQVGLRIAREQRPRGIVLDVRLPDMDGWRVMEKLRADPATSMIPVHFISALDASERGLAMGAVGYLTKPVTRRDLVQVIESLVPRAAARSSRILVVEDDTVTADSVLRMLEAEGLEARRVSSAEEALAVLANERFGCMILDLSLPDMNGLDLLRALPEAVGPEAPKVVVYTARALSRAETKSLEAYAEAVVLKDGSSVERLLEEVRLFVRRFQGSGASGAGARPAKAPDLHPVDLRFEGRKVLVVDDDMRTVYALSATLRAKGIEVVVADTGKAALAMLDERPDLEVVLMDIMMPEMDGYEAMRRIRRDARFAALPIIALTAKAMKGDEEKCLEAGASHYLPKPIDPERLLALIATCLGKPEARARV
jgi:CheY-like chemotaxis protein/signal transduction histidine kinase/HAMP domain-containing protein